MSRIRGEGQPLPAAVIGAGGRVGKYYLNALRDAGAPVIAFDTNPQKMQAQANEVNHSGLRIARTMEEALDQAKVVYILTPDHIRRGVADSALEHPNIGTVVIEKPLANNLEDAKTLYQLTKDNGKRVIVGSTYRATRQFEKIKEGVRGGEIGKLLQAKGTYDHDMRTVHDEWRRDGEGQDWHYGAAHPTDTIIDIIGEPVTNVTTRESRTGLVTGTNGYRRPDQITMIMEFDSGTQATVSMNMATPRSPSGMFLEVAGDEGFYQAHNKNLPGLAEGEYIAFIKGQQTPEVRRVKPEYTIPRLVAVAEKWAQGEVNNPYPFATVDQALDLTSVIDASKRSAENGRTERVLYQRS